MAVSSIYLFVQLWQINFKCDVISSEKITLVLSVTDHIDYNWRQPELVDLFNAFFSFHVEIHVLIIDIQNLNERFWWRGVALIFLINGFFFEALILCHERIDRGSNQIIRQFLKIGRVFGRLLGQKLSECLNIIVPFENIFLNICLLGFNWLQVNRRFHYAILL